MPVVSKIQNKSSAFAPPYKKIESDLRTQIASGSFPPGSMLSSRRDLSKQYGVDVNTIQRAIKLLIDDGLLRADGWRGTFVTGAAAAPSPYMPEVLPLGDRVAQFTVGIVAPLPSAASIGPTDEVWPGIILHAVERVFSHESEISIDFRNLDSAWQSQRLPGVKVVEQLIDSGCDAILAIYPDNVDDVVAICEQRCVPIVLVTASYHVSQIAPRVTYNNIHDGFLAASHLIKRGYSKIVYFNIIDADWSDDRLTGIKQAVANSGATITLTVVDQEKLSQPSMATNQELLAYRLAPELLTAIDTEVGIIAVNDNTAIALHRRADDAGLRPGRDFGLVSFDDLPVARELGVSSLKPPLDEMGAQAAEMVLKALRNEPVPMHVVLPSNIVPRKSTVPQVKEG